MSVVSFLVILAAGAALALAVGGVSPAKPAMTSQSYIAPTRFVE
jgi:hypothetical protein